MSGWDGCGEYVLRGWRDYVRRLVLGLFGLSLFILAQHSVGTVPANYHVCTSSVKSEQRLCSPDQLDLRTLTFFAFLVRAVLYCTYAHLRSTQYGTQGNGAVLYRYRYGIRTVPVRTVGRYWHRPHRPSTFLPARITMALLHPYRYSRVCCLFPLFRTTTTASPLFEGCCCVCVYILTLSHHG